MTEFIESNRIEYRIHHLETDSEFSPIRFDGYRIELGNRKPIRIRHHRIHQILHQTDSIFDSIRYSIEFRTSERTSVLLHSSQYTSGGSCVFWIIYIDTPHGQSIDVPSTEASETRRLPHREVIPSFLDTS